MEKRLTKEKTNLGQYIKEYRSRRGLSLERLASRAGISKTYLWGLEHGKHDNPSIDVLDRLASALGVDLITLVSQVKETSIERQGMERDKMLWKLVKRRITTALEAPRYVENVANPVKEGFAEFSRDLISDYTRDEPGDSALEWVVYAAKKEKERRYPEAIEAYEKALRLTSNIDAQAFIEANLGELCLQNDPPDYRGAYFHFLRSLKGTEGHPWEREDLIRIHTQLGWLCYRAAQYPAAKEHFGEAIKLLKDMEPKEGLLQAYRGLGSCYQKTGDFEKAEKYLKEGIDVALNLKDGVEIAWSTFRRAFLFLEMGCWEEAKMGLGEALRKSKELSSRDHWSVQTFQGIVLNNIGLLKLREGNYKKAEAKFRKSQKITEKAGDRRGLAFNDFFFATLYAERGNWEKALEHVDAAEREFADMGIRYYLPETSALRAQIYCALGYEQAALSIIKRAVKSIPESNEYKYQRAIAQRALAFVHTTMNELNEAQKEFEESKNILEEIGAKYELARTYRDYARMLLKKGSDSAAKENFIKAASIARNIGAKGLLKEVERDLGQLQTKAPQR
jgi:tetratricopeptide (TPR) repeat protein/DNA-binding XRE family transcriptional regulator